MKRMLVILGAAIVVLYFAERRTVREFRFVWLLVTLSFLFYIPVAVAAGIVGGVVFPAMYACIALLRAHESHGYGRLYVLAQAVAHDKHFFRFKF